MELIKALSCTWERNILEIRGICYLCVDDNYFSKKSRLYVLNKLNSKNYI